MKILVISFYYPPYAGVGSNRVLRFRRYLREAGRDVLVLTPSRGKTADDAELADVPQVIKRLACVYSTKDTNERQKSHFHSFLSKLLKCLSVPDRQVYWLPFAIRNAAKIVRQKEISLIYTTSPPESSHLIGVILKRMTKIPWIAEFRDTWTYDPLNPYILRSNYRFAIDSYLEKMVVVHADGLVVNSTIAQRYFQRRYFRYKPSKIATVYTGYEPADFDTVTKPVNKKKFRIVHTGSLSLSRSARTIKPFLDGLAHAVKKLPEMRRTMEVLFVGDLSIGEKVRIRESVVRDMISVIPQVPYKEALQYQMSADLLLCIGHVSDVPTADILGKVFEYIGANRPILALVSEGATSEIVKKSNGFVAVPDDPLSIGTKIADAYSEYKNGTIQLHRNSGLRETLSTQESVKKLLDFIDHTLCAQAGQDTGNDRMSMRDSY